MSLLLVTSNVSGLTLNCRTTGSPPLNTIWRKDDKSLVNISSYKSVQILRDGLTATYDNFLEVDAPPYQLSGNYSCIVHDSLGRNSDASTIEIRGRKVCYKT